MLAITNRYLGIVHKTFSPARDNARISVHDTGHTGAYTISVSPRNPDAASLTLTVTSGNTLFLQVGKNSVFEIRPWGGSALPLGQLQQLESFLRAVSDGRFEEELTYAGDKLIASKGVLHLTERDVVAKSGNFSMALFRQKKVLSRAYTPY